VRIISAERKGSLGGRVSGTMGQCRISVGRSATAADLKEDWMLTHEMVHFGFPSVRTESLDGGDGHLYEPMRVRAGI
jgi:hypothetical protein